MAIYAQFDQDGECIQLASNVGWSEFGDWVETLKNKPNLTALWTSGACEKIPDLRAEMESQLDSAPPENPDVESVAQQLIHAIDASGSAEILLVTAGVSVDPPPAKKKKP